MPPQSAPPPVISQSGFKGRDDIFFAAVSLTRMPMIVTDPNQPDNPIVFVNSAFEELCGYSGEELLGNNCRFLQGPNTDRETVATVRKAIAERKDVAVEILNYRKDGSAFWNALFISPVFGDDGKLLYFFGSQLDVSRRRDAEDALRQAQKMEAVGQLTGGIAHDFNNLLTVVMGSIDSAVSLSTEPGVISRLNRALEGAKRAAVLTSQLLAFARKQRLEGRSTNLNTLVLTLRDLVDRTLGSNIEIENRLEPNLHTAHVDTVQAEVALLNILINARDAMPDGGKLVIQTENRRIDSEHPAAIVGAAPGDYAVLSVEDDGQGIAPDVLGRVMDPFFTTKEVGKGTGMGLAMVYGFMRQSQGYAHIESQLGKGTRVELYFPAVDDAGLTRLDAHRATTARGGKETILIVEDNPDVMEIAKAALSELGYKLQTATDARQALAALETERFDMIFTDIVMPGGVNGVTLAHEAQRRQPTIKVLLTTGWADRALDGEAERGGFDLIGKPYRREELARRIRVVLDGPDGVT